MQSQGSLAKSMSVKVVATPSTARLVIFRTLRQMLIYAALILGAAIFVLPLYWMLTTSIKELRETFQYPPTIIPRSFTLRPYMLAWEYQPWLLYLRNTMFILIGALAGQLLTSTLCAYGFSRIQFPGRDFVFILILATMMLPNQVTLIPTYILFRELKWLNTFYPLIVPAWFGGGAFNIFLLRQFFSSIPSEMEDAAMIDGSSYLGVWWRIILPLSKPALTVVTVFSIQQQWNAFFGPLIYLDSNKKHTLGLALHMFNQLARSSQTEYVDVGLYTAMMAASTITTLPMIILFVFAQRYFVEGIQMTGIKG
jgi:multiple sugar transport system permease protein